MYKQHDVINILQYYFIMVNIFKYFKYIRTF